MGARIPRSRTPARSAFRRSTEVDWRRPKRERYFDGSFGIDVTFLKSYLSRVPVEVQSVPLTRLGPWLHSEHGRDGPLVGRIDPTRLPSADPNVPLVFVEIAGRAHLVDGHHRLERGRRLGLSVVPVLVLRDEATLRAAMRDSTTVLRYWWIWGVQRWWRRRARSPADGF